MALEAQCINNQDNNYGIGGTINGHLQMLVLMMVPDLHTTNHSPPQVPRINIVGPKAMADIQGGGGRLIEGG